MAFLIDINRLGGEPEILYEQDRKMSPKIHCKSRDLSYANPDGYMAALSPITSGCAALDRGVATDRGVISFTIYTRRPTNSLQVRTSLGMPSFLGSFSLMHRAKRTAVLGSMKRGTPKSTAFLRMT